MRTMTRLVIAGLIMGCATHAYAQDDGPGEASLEAPIATIQLDAQGNVAGLTFGNGAHLDDPQIDPKSLEGLEISGIRRLPFQLLTVGDPANPQTVVVADFAGTTLVKVPSGAGAVLSVHPDGELDITLPPGVQLACPAGCHPVGARCKCPRDISAIRVPAMLEAFDPSTGRVELKVLMSEVPVGAP